MPMSPHFTITCVCVCVLLVTHLVFLSPFALLLDLLLLLQLLGDARLSQGLPLAALVGLGVEGRLQCRVPTHTHYHLLTKLQHTHTHAHAHTRTHTHTHTLTTAAHTHTHTHTRVQLACPTIFLVDNVGVWG